MAYNERIIDSHVQCPGNTCIPSAVEMVLKLHGAVDTDYYELQDTWSGSSFADFDGREIHGFRFKQVYSPADRRATFPFHDLFRRIQDELQQGRMVIISLPSNQGFHVWIIHDYDGGNFHAFSKSDGHTIRENRVMEIVQGIGGTDILVYQRMGQQENVT
jgi:hypothetical protein